MDEILQEHIRFNAERGISRTEIKKNLLEAGWPEGQVHKYIEKTFKTLEKGVLIRVHEVAKRFADNQVLQGVNFDVRAGEIFGLIGMSGTGKTTLLNLLVGFLKPDQGDIFLALKDGTSHSVFLNPELLKQRVGFSTQTPSFYPKLTVLENLEHFATLYHLEGAELRKRCNSLLHLVGLTASKEIVASKLSGGMQKRLDIACALLHDPPILILDEPTADLDPIRRRELWTLIKKINSQGTTILLSSHFLAEIELLCTRIAILQNKKIIELGTAEQLRNIYSKNYEIYLQNADQNYQPLQKVLKFNKDVVKMHIEDGDLVIQTPQPEKVLPIITSYLRREGMLQSLHIARPTLGRVFESVVKR